MKRLALYISISALCFNSGYSQADGLFVDGASVSIGNSALLYIDGNIVNTGSINNSGIITIDGNWQSKGAYTNFGTVNFIGNDQIIDHYNNTFGKININGGGTKSSPSSFRIANELILEDGIIVPSDTAHLVAEEKAIVSLGSDVSHINGMFYHSGTGDKYYPIGKDGVFIPVEMYVYEGSTPIVGYELFNGFETQPRVENSIIEIETEHFWKQDILSGTIDSSILSIPFIEKLVPDHHAQAILQSPKLDSSFSSAGRYYGYESPFLLEKGMPYISTEKKITGSYFALGIEQLLDIRLRYIPNALSRFAPNPEDCVIKVYGNLFSSRGFSFKVINQWGNVVFETRDVELMETVGWDGVNPKTGNHEMSGQYHFVFRAQYKTGLVYEEAGAIYIIE